MFTDWSEVLSSIDVSAAPERQVRAWLKAASEHQSSVDAFVARCASRLGNSSAVRGATRCTQREADQAVTRGAMIDAVPEVGSALAAGDISAAHVDVLAKAAERTSPEAVAQSGLLSVAQARPADAMRRQVTDFVRKHSRDEDEAARLRRQRAARRAVLTTDDDTGMGVLHAEFDVTTYAEVKAAIDAETDRLFRADGGRDGAAEVRTPQQRRADALAALVLGGRGGGAGAAGDGSASRSSGSSGSRTGGPPAVRNQMIVLVHPDGSGHVPGVGPLPRCEVERLMCISDLYGALFSVDGDPLWMGRAVRLATDPQWRALVARDGGCIGCNADPSRCEAHHVRFSARDEGPTNIDNLALVCTHHHHLIHDQGWQVVRGADARWALAPP